MREVAGWLSKTTRPPLAHQSTSSVTTPITELIFYRINAMIMNDMWETTRSTSPVTTPMRRLLKFVLTALVAVLLILVAIPGNIAHAADTTATWNSGSIIYNGNTYSGPADDQTVANLKLPKGTQVYSFVDPAPASSTTGSTTTTGPPRQMHVIFFASDVDSKTASKAKYITYTYVNVSTFKDQSNPSDISIDPQSAGGAAGGASGSASSCQVDGGIGWIVCPVSNFIAKGMDTVFNVLTGFLQVQPLQTGQDTPLLRGWEYMRSIANVAFVIAFLFIIYSQLTSFGMSNYGLRKLLPRLIIAAILVNVSYFICSIAVDISNILGYSIQDIFMNIRNTLVGGNNGWSNGSVMSWSSITSFVLAGGAAGAAGSIALITTLSSFGVGGSVILLLPALVSGLLAVLVALVVLAARQAIIVVLTLIAPLAFVAYLLPNTEKWFEKWRSLFMNMLIIFPAFSVLFGGSQLAGDAIIQTATSINMIILGMLVKVAPLFITPFLMRFSGSMLNGIAKAIQSRGSKVVGSTRTFAKDRAENQRMRRLAIQNPTGRQFLVRNAQRRDHNRRRREGWRNANSAMSDAHWANTLDYSDIDQASRQAGDIKTVGETASNLRYARAKNTNATIRDLDTNIRRAKLEVENAELQSNLNWERSHSAPIMSSKLDHEVLNRQLEAAKAQEARDFEEHFSTPIGHARVPHSLAQLALANRAAVDRARRDARQAIMDTKQANDAKSAAVGEQTLAYAQELKGNQAFAEIAAGITGITTRPNDYQATGILRVQANAQAALAHAVEEAIKNVITSKGEIKDDTGAIKAELQAAIAKHDTISIQAFVDMLANNGAPGLGEIRSLTDDLASSALTNDELMQVKRHITDNAAIRDGAEDVATWARETDRTISAEDIAMGRYKRDIWADMSVDKFVGEKFNTHIAAIHSYTNNGQRMLDPSNPNDAKMLDKFKRIVTNPDIAKTINPDVLQLMKLLVDESDGTLSPADQIAHLKATNIYTDDPTKPSYAYSPHNPGSKNPFGGSW